MDKVALITLLLIATLMPSTLWGKTAKEGIVYSKTGKDLKLYYFDKKMSKFAVKEISNNSKAFQVFSDGTIYCVVKSSIPYQKKILPEFGIRLIYIKAPDNFYNFYSGICVNDTTKQMYFSKKKTKNGKLLVALYNLDLKTGKETKLCDNHEFRFIGIPSISPDGGKIAFYCSVIPHFRLQVACYNIKDKSIKILGPPSTPIFPYGPYMGGAPVWNKSSTEIYFMARYPEIVKKIGMQPAIYKTSLKEGAKPELIGIGGWPTNLNDKIICTLIDKDKSKSGIWCIYPLPLKLILANAEGKVSPSENFVAYTIKNNFYVRNLNNNRKVLLHKNDTYGPNFWWISLKIKN